jgi:hypothetical protein
LCLIASFVVCAYACTITPAPDNSNVSIRSFLGISFGGTIRDTRRIYPTGINEASPLGFPSYHVKGLSSNGISYSDVVYEFDGLKGMQVVVARFAPSSTEATLEYFRRLLGEPTRHTLNDDQRMEEAVWLTPGGEEVRFERSHHMVAIIGPQGGNLRKDVQLRLENSAALL